jgi:cytochrome c553
MLALTAMAAMVATAGAQEIKGDAKAGETKNAMCIGCHGLPNYQASFPQIYKVPKISGQNARYFASALNGYKSGERKHPTMRAIAATLSDQDIADLAAYYSEHGKSADKAPATVSVPDALKPKVAACVACHGANFNDSTDPANPRLAGQHADYLTVALKAYQTSNNPQIGRGNAVMVGMAKPLSSADIKEIAAFLSSLPGELKTVPQSKLHHAAAH